MAKKKRTPPPKKSNRAVIYAVLALLLIAALLIYFSAAPQTPQEKLPYRFTWDNIPGTDSVILKDFLEKSQHAEWVRTATIEKTDDRTVIISDGKNSFSLSLNEGKNKALLKGDDGIIQQFEVKKENGKLNIFPYIRLNRPSTYEPGKVKITEFLKFNCGHCNVFNPQLHNLKQKYGDQLEITYRPMLWRTLPQDQYFRKSIEAYIIAERMGKGAEMKDALFAALFVDRKDLTSEIVLGDIARSVGLGDDFITALKEGDAEDEAEENIRLAESFQVDETPTVIINGNLKVTPAMTDGDINQMTDNLNTIIGSLLG